MRFISFLKCYDIVQASVSVTKISTAGFTLIKMSILSNTQMGVALVINNKSLVMSFKIRTISGPSGNLESKITGSHCIKYVLFFSPSNTSVPNITTPIRNNDIVELVHVVTQKLLNSHDVAAPLSPANQEIAGYVNYSAKFIPYLQWRIVRFVFFCY